jgi:hypothetical protein
MNVSLTPELEKFVDDKLNTKDKPQWVQETRSFQFHLYPLEHTLEFGISDVKESSVK